MNFENVNFYIIINKKTSKLLSTKGKQVWKSTEIIDVKNLIKRRTAIAGYKFNDFLIVNITLDSLPKLYYVLNNQLLNYETHNEMVELLYD